MPSKKDSREPGVVYTNQWVVDLMLDLAGYTSDSDLTSATLVEPGCGDGAFLKRIIPRLMESARRQRVPTNSLGPAIRAYELNPDRAALARAAVVEVLAASGVHVLEAEALSSQWVVEADFLLLDAYPQARWVVGNPPYVRVEDSSPEYYAQYRARWTTMSGRADIYIGFYEAGLSMLNDGGKLCFICADRWMHNQYGAGLRRHIVEGFALKALIELHDADVFDVPVAAYPAVTLIERSPHSTTALATARTTFSDEDALLLLRWFGSTDRTFVDTGRFSASNLDGSFGAEGSWPSGPPERLRLISDLESRLPSLSDVGVTIRVGMATGADKVYVVGDPPTVESKFLKRAVGPADLQDGRVVWRGRYIVSPWDRDVLADLGRYPRLKKYFAVHSNVLKRRYVASRNKESWWRTIDRPPADEYQTPKLIVADINDRIEPVLDSEGYWPLHSAYFITSETWDLETLGGYLLSDVAGAFVEAYSVKMANGHLRISGQYLKKIRLPVYGDVRAEARIGLADAFRRRDRAAASSVVRSLIGSPPDEQR